MNAHIGVSVDATIANCLAPSLSSHQDNQQTVASVIDSEGFESGYGAAFGALCPNLT